MYVSERKGRGREGEGERLERDDCEDTHDTSDVPLVFKAYFDIFARYVRVYGAHARGWESTCLLPTVVGVFRERGIQRYISLDRSDMEFRCLEFVRVILLHLVAAVCCDSSPEALVDMTTRKISSHGPPPRWV